MTAVVEISDDEDIQSVNSSMSKIMGNKSSLSLLTSVSKTTWAVFLGVLTTSKYLTFLYATLACAVAKSCRSPSASKATTRVFQWWKSSFRLVSEQRRLWQTLADHLLPTQDGRRVVKDCFNLIFLDGGLQYAGVYILEKSNENLWNAGHLTRHFVLHRNGAEINQAGTVKIRKVYNTASVMAHRNSTFVDTMKAQTSYSGAFSMKHKSKLVSGFINDILDNTMSSEYIPTRMQVPYVRNILFPKMFINDIDLLPLL